MNSTPIDILAYMTQFLPVIGKIRFARSCRRFYKSKVFEPIITAARAYDPKNPTAFPLACRNAEEHFIDIHIARRYASRALAVIYCVEFGHARLVEKYLHSCHMSCDMVSASLFTSLGRNRGDIFELLWPRTAQFGAWFNKARLFRYLLPRSANKRAYELLRDGNDERIIDAVAQCDLNPYTAIFFDPLLEEAIMMIKDRANPRTHVRKGPMNLEDELGFAYLVHDEDWIADVQAQMIAVDYKLYEPQKIMRAAVATGAETVLDGAIKMCSTVYDDTMSDDTMSRYKSSWDPVDCLDNVPDGNEKMLSRLMTEIVTAWSSGIPISHIFKTAEPSMAARIIKEIVKTVVFEGQLNIMEAAFVNMNVEVIDFLREQRGVPLPKNVVPGTCQFFCYVHPKMLSYMREVGINEGTINWVLTNNDCLHLLEVKV